MSDNDNEFEGYVGLGDLDKERLRMLRQQGVPYSLAPPEWPEAAAEEAEHPWRTRQTRIACAGADVAEASPQPSTVPVTAPAPAPKGKRQRAHEELDALIGEQFAVTRETAMNALGVKAGQLRKLVRQGKLARTGNGLIVSTSLRKHLSIL